jgi:cytochrome oxidase Cu insertion factor (SCO1/SenC/PrrC family)
MRLRQVKFRNKYIYITFITIVLLIALSVGLMSKTRPSGDSEIIADPHISGLMEAAGIHSFEDIQAAPGFDLESLDGSKVELDSLKGNTVLLSFWATW